MKTVPLMFVLLPLGVLLLAACNTPGPGFRGVEATRVTVKGVTFDVRVDGTRAEAMRRNGQWAPRLGAVAPQAVAAIERVSGCRVRRLDGDAALMTAWLDCGQRQAPLPRGNTYDCDVYSISDGLAELTCERVRY
ncbi:hypothetical protein [Pelagivirga sediminicola]|uniref:hypothetical protein n=1 Tax=Pelagivirga sediminicola TaxID=2170575 RepID=UPI001A9C3BA4|nr:hypothetical protein [Pelagivirga sediminicola]